MVSQMAVSHLFLCLISIPSCTCTTSSLANHLSRDAFWIGLKPFWIGLVPLEKRPSRHTYPPFTEWGYNKKMPSATWKMALVRTQLHCHPDLRPPGPRTVRKKSQLFVSHSVYGTVLEQPEQMKTRLNPHGTETCHTASKQKNLVKYSALSAFKTYDLFMGVCCLIW